MQCDKSHKNRKELTVLVSSGAVLVNNVRQVSWYILIDKQAIDLKIKRLGCLTNHMPYIPKPK